ncbi:MAG TPA: hypothetical protein VFM37_08465 [Pseudonocardiaceae bacterium]|nr:hypothetical protein [Pseudonocardiaceae bacterium]
MAPPALTSEKMARAGIGGDWCLLLTGGASGTGRSRVSHALARRLGVSVLETDDLVTAIKAATTPRQLPLLHCWDNHPAAHGWPAPQICELTESVLDTLQPVFDTVIADHLDTGTRVVMEGDHLLRNYAAREPHAGRQQTRAEVSALLGRWLAGQAATVGVPVVTARPWPTAARRNRRRPRAGSLARSWP